jgi:hypothetical protein
MKAQKAIARPIFIVRLPAAFPIEQAQHVHNIMGQNLGSEYNVLVIVDDKRKGHEIKFECHNANYSNIEWEALEKRVNSIVK